MTTEFVDVPSHSAPSRSEGGGRRMVTETIEIEGSTRTESAGDAADVMRLGGDAPGGRKLSATAQKMLANIDKHGVVDDPDDAVETPEEKAAAAAPIGTEPKVETPDAVVVTPEPAKPEPANEHLVANERLATRNRELLAELETLRAAPAQQDLPARFKALDEAERLYIDDPIGALRRFIAVVHGIDDPSHKDVESELAGLYQDLTAKELGVALDDGKQAARESARTRKAWEREKRERKAAEEAAAKLKPADTEADDTATKHAIITNEISVKRADGKSLAERYPLTMKFAERLTGQKPEAVLWANINRGFATGELSRESSNDQLIESVAQKLEPLYQALGKEFVEALTPASTAPPAVTTDARDSKASATSNGARTITTRDASVAPATSPAIKAEQVTKTEDKPAPKPWRNERERREHLARQHFDK